MSEKHKIDIVISALNGKRVDNILEALVEIWPFDYAVSNDSIECWGYGALLPDETEADMANCIAFAIFDANDGPCDVAVTLTRLVFQPGMSYRFNGDHQPCIRPQ